MKLLLDENLSDRVVAQILDLYPGSTHVKLHGLLRTDDALVWTFAQQQGYVIVSKDADFHQRSLVFGHPPKLVYRRDAGSARKALSVSRGLGRDGEVAKVI